MEYNDWVLSVPEILERFHARASPASDWWLKFAFHYTDVRNAANIIETGHLYSRNKALEDDSMTNDNANPDVIAQSSDSHDWVRLYFRPKTPTQYRNEGIKPASTQGDGHCPVPVFFFFDMACMLQLNDTCFSGRGLNKKRETPDIYSDPHRLLGDNVPARKIYHYGAYSTDQDDIKDRRHAEIVYPDSLPLSECLTGIVCRSQAEKETLKHLIRNSKNYNKYNDLINSAATGDLFYRRNIYIDSVTTSIDRNGESKTVVKFEYSNWNSLKVNKYEIKIKDKNSDRLYSAEGELEIKSPNPMKIIIPDKLRNIRIEIRLNGCLAFVSDRQTQPVYF